MTEAELKAHAMELADRYVPYKGIKLEIYMEGACHAILEYNKYLNERDLNLFPFIDYNTWDFIYI